MRKQLIYVSTLALLGASVALGQRPEDHGDRRQEHEDHRESTPRANQGRVPPQPERRDSQHGRPEVERHTNGRVNETQHVSGDHWYGHDRPDDRRFRVEHPYEHGRFEHFGPSYRYRVERFDRDRHWFWLPGGFQFEVASWDWPICAGWCWDCSDDFVVYEDPDHIGWYMLYNVHTGVYVHVTYMGN